MTTEENDLSWLGDDAHQVFDEIEAANPDFGERYESARTITRVINDAYGSVVGLPWVADLPMEEGLIFRQELQDALLSLEQLLFSWRGTARVWADPALAKEALRSIDDLTE